jgi:hypothetical protein
MKIMKKLPVFAGLMCAALGFLSAQGFTPAQYEETSLAAFREWRFNHSGEEKSFKIPVLFNSAGEIALVFIDSTLEEQIEFESDLPWPPMQSGQGVTIYLSAWGPWVWDRHLDAIDYGGGRLVQAGSLEGPAAPPLPAQGGALADGALAGGASTGGSQTAQTGGSGVPVTNPTPAEINSSREDPAPSGFDYGKQPTITPRQVIVQISGNPPQRGRYYRLQVGSFAVPGNAAKAANSLKEAGLNPAFEEFRSNVRVVLSHVPGEDVEETARKIGRAGFSEVWCREEP